jgi:hypothetical protein
MDYLDQDLVSALVDEMAEFDEYFVEDSLDDFAVRPRQSCSDLSQRNCTRQSCGYGGSGLCSWLGPNRRCVCIGSGPYPGPYPRPRSANRYENNLDTMIDQAFRVISGGRGGRVRTDISPWESLMNQTIQAIQIAIRHLQSPRNLGMFYNALRQATILLNRTGAEVRRAMSGSRQTAVLDQLGNAAVRLQAAGAQATGRSILGGRSFLDPATSLQTAIGNVRAARDAVGLRSI